MAGRMPISVFVRYNGKDVKYEFDPERPLDTHVTNLCSLFNLSLPDLYCLQISSTYSFLTPQVSRMNYNDKSQNHRASTQDTRDNEKTSMLLVDCPFG
jgi:hypothetical protein